MRKTRRSITFDLFSPFINKKLMLLGSKHIHATLKPVEIFESKKNLNKLSNKLKVKKMVKLFFNENIIFIKLHSTFSIMNNRKI